MAAVELRGVVKRYGDTHAVRDLSLTVEDGELVVLVGPSGSGKTTTLRIVAGLESLDAGTILVDGRDVTAAAPGDRDVAMVFQSYALFPHLDVHDNLAFGLHARRVPREETARRVAEVSETLGLTRLLDRKPRQLSGGERQRVALGRAIIRHPALFLMDEPLSNLDARLRVQTRAEIQRLQARLGVTTIYVTHDQAEALALGHRIGVLDGGVLQQLGTPREIYEEPANAFVAGFVGSPPMNLVPAVARDGALEWDGGFVACEAAVAAGARVLLGIRPEHVSLAAPSEPGTVPGVVEAVESTGDQVIVVVEAGSAAIALRTVPGGEPAAGERVALRFRAERIRVFDEDGAPVPPR